MNEVIKNINERRSIRFYKPEPVKSEDVETILDCAKIAPSGLNRQSWHFTVLRDRALMDEISAANKEMALASGNPDEIERASEPNYDNFRGAPMAILIAADDSDPYGVADCANAATIITLAATSLGLGSCYIASYSRVLKNPRGAALLARLGLPAGYSPAFAVCLGHIGEQPKPRKPLKPDSVNRIG
ncbi:MAG: nitroreductase family protein [Oscillospiraceae bacterium]|nr:nitroreductase family protein [Oscillospiraceae bacterium]